MWSDSPAAGPSDATLPAGDLEAMESAKAYGTGMYTYIYICIWLFVVSC